LSRTNDFVDIFDKGWEKACNLKHVHRKRTYSDIVISRQLHRAKKCLVGPMMFFFYILTRVEERHVILKHMGKKHILIWAMERCVTKVFVKITSIVFVSDHHPLIQLCITEK